MSFLGRRVLATLLAISVGSRVSVARAQARVWDLRGAHHEDAFGASLAIPGDLDRDGVADLLIGSPGVVPDSEVPGRVELFSGSLLASAAPFRTWHGDVVNDGFGTSAAALADIDGDGVPDFAVGAPNRSVAGLPTGAVFVYSGASGALLRTILSSSTTGPIGAELASIADLDFDGVRELICSDVGSHGPIVTIYSGATGNVIRSHAGAAGSGFGASKGTIDHVGDIDGDGIEDYAVGAPTDSSSFPTIGLVYLYSGATGNPLRTLSDGSTSSGFGTTVSGANDVSGDGHADVCVLDPNDTSTGGTLHLIDGTTGIDLLKIPASGRGPLSEAPDVDGDGLPDIAYLAEIYSSANGALLASISYFDLDGTPDAVDATVDIDGDGLLDIVASSSQSSSSPYAAGFARGQTAVAYGDPNYLKWQFLKKGETYDSNLGAATALVPDRDGDGWRDLAIGEPRGSGGSPASGAVTIRSSRDGRILSTIDSRAATSGPAGGVGDLFGWCVAALDDVNGDGVEDLAISAPTRELPSTSSFGCVEIRSGADDSLIWTVNADDEIYFGSWIASGTDSNQHVFIVVGAPFSQPNGLPGQVDVFDVTSRVKTLTLGSGRSATSAFGAYVGCVGDMDGDGVLDWFVRDYFARRQGLLYFSGADGHTLWSLDGVISEYGAISTSDLDGDGVRDVMVGDYRAATGEGVTAYSVATGAILFHVKTPDAVSTNFGGFLSELGDVNGDGLPDFAIGASLRDSPGFTQSGSVFVVSGRKGELLARLDGDADGAFLGWRLALSRIGRDSDVDGDGIPDVVTSAQGADQQDRGFGRASLFRLDDLMLQIDPPVASSGMSVEIDTRGGPGGNLTGLEFVDLDGAPVGSFIAFGSFDAKGIWSVIGTVPSGLSGHVLTLRSYALGYGSRVVDSQDATLTIQ